MPRITTDYDYSVSQADQENMATSICYISQGTALILGPILMSKFLFYIDVFMPFIASYGDLFSLSGLTLMFSSFILALSPIIV